MDIKDTIRQETELKTELVVDKIKEKHKKNIKHHQVHHKMEAGGVLADVQKDSMRTRFEGKKMNRIIKESRPVKVIEKEKFNSLKAIFEKKTEISISNDDKSYKLILESKLATFTDKENIKLDANSQIKSVPASLSEGILKRIENLSKLKESNKKDNSFVDPILENIKVKSSKESNQDDEDSEEHDSDVVFSENTSIYFENDILSDTDDVKHQGKNRNKEVCDENLDDDKSIINKIPALEIEKNELIFDSNQNDINNLN